MDCVIAGLMEFVLVLWQQDANCCKIDWALQN